MSSVSQKGLDLRVSEDCDLRTSVLYGICARASFQHLPVHLSRFSSYHLHSSPSYHLPLPLDKALLPAQGIVGRNASWTKLKNVLHERTTNHPKNLLVLASQDTSGKYIPRIYLLQP